MMPSAGGVFLGVVKRRNAMIADAVSLAAFAFTEAIHTDYAMAPIREQVSTRLPTPDESTTLKVAVHRGRVSFQVSW
jgi:hypothetical protein